MDNSVHIRRLQPRDHTAVLAINAAGWPGVARLEPADMDGLVSRSGTHWVAERDGGVVGYLLSFAAGEPFDDEEMRFFRQRLSEPFIYVAQIALASDHRRMGVGTMLYRTAFRAARRGGSGIVGCDVNLRPPNEPSMRFHLRLGFQPMGELELPGGFHVALMTIRVPLTADMSEAGESLF